MTATFELPGLATANVQLDINNENVPIVSGESTISSKPTQPEWVPNVRATGRPLRAIAAASTAHGTFARMLEGDEA